jgi:hypothetical protein
LLFRYIMISQVRGSLFVRPWTGPLVCPIAVVVCPRDERVVKLIDPKMERICADDPSIEVPVDSTPFSDRDASVGDSHSTTEAYPQYILAPEDRCVKMNSSYRTRHTFAQLHHCANVYDSALSESKSIMSDLWEDLVMLVDASQLSRNEKANELIDSVIKLVNCHRLGPTTNFTADMVRNTLYLEGSQEAFTGTPDETACTALCVMLPNEEQRRLQQYADYGLGELTNDAVYQEAIQLRQLARPCDPADTYRLLLERRALRVHMQCIEVLVGPDPFTVCKKMLNIENIQLRGALLKGIVLSEGCESCELVVQLLNLRGSVLTPPATEPEHIAAYLVLALHYTGEELLGLLEQWHYDKTGLVLHPEALFPRLASPVSQEITGTSVVTEPGVFYAQYADESEDDEESGHSSAGTDISDWCENAQY